MYGLKSVGYMSLSDLLNEHIKNKDIRDAIYDLLGNSEFVWGGSEHTMIQAHDIANELIPEDVFSGDAGYGEFLNALQELGGTLIDLET